MSRDWFNYAILDQQFNAIKEGQVINRPDEILGFLSDLLKGGVVDRMQDLYLCLEHTGKYVQHLVRAWMSKNGRLSLVAASCVSEQMRGKQGWSDKDDSLDALRLAEYGIRFSDKLKPWQLSDQSLEKLRVLQRQRSRLIKAINLLKVPSKESEEFDSMDIYELITQHQTNSLVALKQDLAIVESTIQKIIREDEQLNQLFQWTKSVPGVGPVIATEILITTEGFTKFTPDQAKSYARYIGIVPLTHHSGSSVRKKNKTKKMNIEIKSILTMGATSLLTRDNELSQYYRRKISEGKHHSVVLNALRNKIILRIFAVVRNQTMYQKNYACV
jgi:transposase